MLIRARWITVVVVVGIFVASVYGFGFVKQMFFPNSTRPQFFIECYFPEGTHIREVEKHIDQAEKYLAGLDGVTHVASAIGGGEPRILLTYVPGAGSYSYATMFVDVDEYQTIDRIAPKVQTDIEALMPDATFNVRKFLVGPGEGGKIQLRLSGPDRTDLREMATKVKDIMRASGNAKAVRDEWKEKVKVARPQLREAPARQLGITRPAVCDTLLSVFEGKQTSVYREGEELLPIIARAPEAERAIVGTGKVRIWSPVAQQMIPMRQVVEDCAEVLGVRVP